MGCFFHIALYLYCQEGHLSLARIILRPCWIWYSTFVPDCQAVNPIRMLEKLVYLCLGLFIVEKNLKKKKAQSLEVHSV